MLWQIKKIVHCHFPDLTSKLSAIQEQRKGSIAYSIEELIMSAIVLFLLKYDSRNDFNNRYKDEQFRKNYQRMFGMSLPHMDAVNDLLEKIDPNDLEAVRCHLISVLIEKRVFHKFRFFGNYFHIAVDATGVYNWGNEPCEAVKEFALTKESIKGKISYSNYVLEAALIFSNGTSIPLLSEWIANDGQNYDKQDCESKAFKRLAVRLKKYFPRLPVCILADGLYTNVSMMDICKEYGWKFILVFKDGNLPSVWEEVNRLLPITRMVECHQESFYNATQRTVRKYRSIKNVEYKKHDITWVECIQECVTVKTGEKKENRFVFLTNCGANRDNIASLITAGRGRWFIEDHCVVLKYVDSTFNKKLRIMELEKNVTCRKKDGKNCSFEFKTFVIAQINNGQISLNFASKKYNISRSTLDYWRSKLSNHNSKNNAMSLERENKKLRERVEELEFVKDFQQDLIVEFEKITGRELSKKFLPELLSREIERKKKKLSK